MSLMNLVTLVAVGLSIASFATFVLFAWRLRMPEGRSIPAPRGPGLGDNVEQQSLNETLAAMAKLIEATSKLADSLAKAGPLIASLVASMLFLAFALVSAYATTLGT